MPSNTELIAGTLAWCNERRAAKNLEPLTELPKGRPRDPKSCPCGAATGLYVLTQTCYSSEEAYKVYGFPSTLPRVVMEFVSAFDSGQIPEMVAE